MTTTPVRLETSRLLLRPFELGDIDDVCAYASDPQFARYLPGLPQPYTRADAEAFVHRCQAQDPALRTEWAIERAEHVIGSVDARFETRQRASIGYGIGRAHWRQGLTTEAARAVVDWLFTAFPLVRVYATADARNLGSRSVMRKLGMQHEATLRLHRVDRDGEPADEVMYGLLRTEWEAARI